MRWIQWVVFCHRFSMLKFNHTGWPLAGQAVLSKCSLHIHPLFIFCNDNSRPGKWRSSLKQKYLSWWESLSERWLGYSHPLICDYHHMRDSLTKKIRVCFLLATNNESPSRYCFRLISWFSNQVLSFFRRTSRATIALVLFFWSTLLNFNISCRETTSSFLRLSI